MSGTNILTATSAVPFLKCSLIDQNNKKALGVVSIEKICPGDHQGRKAFQLLYSEALLSCFHFGFEFLEITSNPLNIRRLHKYNVHDQSEINQLEFNRIL